MACSFVSLAPLFLVGLLLKRVTLWFHFGQGNKHTRSVFALVIIGRDQGKFTAFTSIFELRRVQNDASIVV